MKSLNSYITEKFQVSKDSIFTNTIEDILEIYGCVENKDAVPPTSYHANKRYCKVFKISSEAYYAIRKFYDDLHMNDSNRISLWDIIDKRQIDIVDEKKYGNITVEKYSHINGAMFKVGIRDTNDRLIFHISFEKDIWIVSDKNEITNEELDDCIEICKNIIDYIFSTY